MANVVFKKGLLTNLPATYTEGTFYVTTDEHAIYLDVSNDTRIRLGDFQEFATLEALQANTNPSTTALYYVDDINCLAKWNGSEYIQINRDTGMTSVEVTGTGNAITAAVYDASGRKLTLTKGATYMTASDVDNKISAKVGTEAMAEAQKKVASVTAGDASVTVAGTATAPTIAAKVSQDANNALELAKDGLKVVIPAAAEYSISKDTDSGDYAAVYHLTKNGANVGAAINIPKDMVVQSGSVVENPTGQPAGTYIELVLQNVADPLYINVGSLIEYVTSGSQAGDMIVVVIIFSVVMIWRTMDLTPLCYLIPSVAAEFSAGTVSYYSKAKIENRIKLMRSIGVEPSEQAFSDNF